MDTRRLFIGCLLVGLIACGDDNKGQPSGVANNASMDEPDVQDPDVMEEMDSQDMPDTMGGMDMMDVPESGQALRFGVVPQTTLDLGFEAWTTTSGPEGLSFGRSVNLALGEGYGQTLTMDLWSSAPLNLGPACPFVLSQTMAFEAVQSQSEGVTASAGGTQATAQALETGQHTVVFEMNWVPSDEAQARQCLGLGEDDPLPAVSFVLDVVVKEIDGARVEVSGECGQEDVKRVVGGLRLPWDGWDGMGGPQEGQPVVQAIPLAQGEPFVPDNAQAGRNVALEWVGAEDMRFEQRTEDDRHFGLAIMPDQAGTVELQGPQGETLLELEVVALEALPAPSVIFSNPGFAGSEREIESDEYYPTTTRIHPYLVASLDEVTFEGLCSDFRLMGNPTAPVYNGAVTSAAFDASLELVSMTPEVCAPSDEDGTGLFPSMVLSRGLPVGVWLEMVGEGVCSVELRATGWNQGAGFVVPLSAEFESFQQ